MTLPVALPRLLTAKPKVRPKRAAALAKDTSTKSVFDQSDGTQLAPAFAVDANAASQCLKDQVLKMYSL